MTGPASPELPPVRLVTCPTCSGPSVYAPNNPFRPFCCDRCKQIDLGAWASEQFAVPAPAPPDSMMSDAH